CAPAARNRQQEGVRYSERVWFSISKPGPVGMSVRQGRSQAYAALVFGILCISWSAIFVRWTAVPGPASAFYRLLIPAGLLLPTWLLPGSSGKLPLRSWAIVAVGGFFFDPGLTFFHSSTP